MSAPTPMSEWDAEVERLADHFDTSQTVEREPDADCPECGGIGEIEQRTGAFVRTCPCVLRQPIR